MNIELRNISHNARLSRETTAFAADIFVDGKCRGNVHNDGNGGPDMISPHSLATELEAYAATLPEVKLGENSYKQTADLMLGNLLNRYLEGKRLARMLKAKTLFVREGKIYATKGAVAEGLTVLNTMPFEDALTLFLGTVS
jgi:hypothetical protein